MTRLALLAVLTLIAVPAEGRDGWADRPPVCNPALMNPTRLAQCQQWISTVQQPDMPASCCGDGDAVITDDSVDIGGAHYAIVTEDYPGIPDFRESLPKGTKILIPPNKLNNTRKDGNPSGHSVTFIGPTGQVLCYFPNGVS